AQAGSGRNAPGAHSLCRLVPQALQRILPIGHSQNRIVRSYVDLRGELLFMSAKIADVELLYLPRQQALLNLLGEAAGIDRRAKCLLGKNACRLVIAVTVARVSGKAADDH